MGASLNFELSVPHLPLLNPGLASYISDHMAHRGPLKGFWNGNLGSDKVGSWLQLGDLE